MSKSYMILLVADPETPCKYCGTGGLPGGACENCRNTGLEYPLSDEDIDGVLAKVFMRLHERPSDAFMNRVASENPGKRVYCLLGASTWYGPEA